MRVRLAGVSHAFPGGAELFRPVTFEAGDGDLVALTGPSGSGKSTLLAIVAGWIAPTQGTVEFDGQPRYSWVAQNPFGVPHRSALDHVTLPLLAAGASRREADEEGHGFLKRFGLEALARRPFAQLSGGEGQRLMLARALATRAELLLVDEPTAQLDATSAGSVARTLDGLAGQGHIVLIATHDPRIFAHCPRRIDLEAP